ncbi:MAG: ROK family transcriptional regulator, partial [Ilumatobacteraceae bacterium]
MKRRTTDVVRPQAVRQSNLAVLLETLRTSGPVSRSELGAATGLTRSAISGLVGELVSLGLADEHAALPDGRPGRPSPVVHVATAHFVTLAVEVGVDDLSVAIVGLDGKVLRSHRSARPRGRAPIGATVADIAELVRRLGWHGEMVDGRRVLAIGVAVPGVITEPGDVIVTAPNLGWYDLDLGPLLREALGVELPVFVGNDADLGALAEARFGAGVGARTMLFVSGEVGVGGGLVVDGRRVAGHRGFAGEIGHIP